MENNQNEDLIKILEESLKNKIKENKEQDELNDFKLKIFQNKILKIIGNDEDFMSMSAHMPFYNNNNVDFELSKNKKKFNSEECCICFIDLKSTFTVTTNCNHNLCLDCLTKLRNKCCPLCRTEFPEKIKNTIDNINNKNSYSGKQPINEIEGIDSYFLWSGTPASFNPTIRYS